MSNPETVTLSETVIADLRREFGDKIRELQEEVSHLKQALSKATEYNAVRQNMIIVLREMLCTFSTHFNFDIQPTIGIPVADEILLHETDPSKVVERARQWIPYHRGDKVKNCDFNARFCWATLHGQKSRAWLDEPSCVDPKLLPVTIEGWINERQERLSSNKSIMIVRFISDGTEGHSVVSYNYNGKVVTFQAYFNVCEIKLLDYDVFTDKLISKLRDKSPVNASDFGLITSLHSLTYLTCRYLTM